MRFFLIGNYRQDRQESMERFTLMLSSSLKAEGSEAQIWRPPVFLGGLAQETTVGFGKWLGYVDKWLLYPLILTVKVQLTKIRYHKVFFHICDHSNAPYLSFLPKNCSAITCHDVLAIRGALGYSDAYCPSSKLGKILQKVILRTLIKAKLIACVSELTLQQLKLLTKIEDINQGNWTVIYNAFNADFKPVSKEDSAITLANVSSQLQKPFLLHVGSSLPRKNRKLLIYMLAELKSRWDGNICFAGEPLEEDLVTLATHLKVEKRIISVKQPNHSTLLALYSACEALVFPSFSEGFGWPIIEAQACGSPVITSNIAPMTEVGGKAALYANPLIPAEFINAFSLLRDRDLRFRIIQEGFENCKRFNRTKMVKSYLNLYGLNNNCN